MFSTSQAVLQHLYSTRPLLSCYIAMGTQYALGKPDISLTNFLQLLHQGLQIVLCFKFQSCSSMSRVITLTRLTDLTVLRFAKKLRPKFITAKALLYRQPKTEARKCRKKSSAVSPSLPETNFRKPPSRQALAPDQAMRTDTGVC